MSSLTLLLLLGALATPPERPLPGAPAVAFTIAAYGTTPFVRGRSMPIQCTFRNPAGGTPTEIELKLFGADGLLLDVPWYLEARVTDMDGNVVTRDGVRPGWWSWNTLQSDLCIEAPDTSRPCRSPGDLITLQPAQVVHRVIYLDRVLLGSPPLRPGSYRVQLRWGHLVSPDLLISIVGAEGA